MNTHNCTPIIFLLLLYNAVNHASAKLIVPRFNASLPSAQYYFDGNITLPVFDPDLFSVLDHA